MPRPRDPEPDFLIVGSPKAGSTALHDALAVHPQLFASPVKEPKFFLCDGRRPDPAHQRGPGDAHSAQEWIWREREYRRLFAGAPQDTLRYESTPFYLWDTASHRRIAEALPQVKLIAVIRDPVDRAYSNWTHLWADGLEPEPDFLSACRQEPRRIAQGWAPFWRYLELGRYGEQLAHLFGVVDRDRVLVLRYRQIVDEPIRTLDAVCRFLGVQTGLLDGLPAANLGRWAPDSGLNSALRQGVRLGASLGSFVHPQVWRTASRPVLSVLQRGSGPRPKLDPTHRAELVGHYAQDNAVLCSLLGPEYRDWLAAEGRGTFTVRRG